jgi:uncharacterized cupredoxin-like copper-binding protein
MRATQHKTIPVIAAAVGALLLVGGCGSSGSAGSASPGQSSAAGPTTTVTATETEFKIALSQSSFKPGMYTFKVVNHGKFPHNLTVQGPGVNTAGSPTLPGGGSGEVTVTLQAGSYELWCSVDSHKDKGYGPDREGGLNRADRRVWRHPSGLRGSKTVRRSVSKSRCQPSPDTESSSLP